MKIYTRTGDEGKTSVIGGRVKKDDTRVEAYGTIDELNSFVGQAASVLARETTANWEDLLERLTLIQHELFDCGSDLCYANPEPEKMKVTPSMTERLEGWIDHYEAQTPPITKFILPGGGEAASLLHVCRTVCRRAERRVVTLAEEQPCPDEVRKYLNRLSDFFFTVARAANARLGLLDVEYERGAPVFRRRS
ncbi:cob(I)yrinic acid a,c-diamide adenosyltransferase [Cohnella cholangitidis]|uniref:Corrinoid adenosyltransferase n=1 Tax=Cohnella cholangitidis TaxID=2598458 RepID=A0A7G5C2N6_9BACL|nr:cob(I)yrinic acid a,c-diamide adenosyltransferase [Cohnella cholangitidis]QMV43470.1 cob(I)yrinic acid a,c-diamide adenosyltransferase [Cohnella cholangitidis]